MYKQLERKNDKAQIAQSRAPQIQRKETPNKTGLPDNLKDGIERLSGYDMSDVKVHYNSSKPAQLNAHAYAQGTQIHLGAGQQKTFTTRSLACGTTKTRTCTTYYEYERASY